MRLALALFILIPIIEIAVFIQAGSWLGTGTTLMLILLTAVIGIVLIRRQGVAMVQERRLFDHEEQIRHREEA